MCVCVCACVSACECVDVLACVQKSEQSVMCIPLLLSYCLEAGFLMEPETQLLG